MDPDIVTGVSNMAVSGGSRTEQQLHRVVGHLGVPLRTLSTKLTAKPHKRYLLAVRRAMAASPMQYKLMGHALFAGIGLLARCGQCNAAEHEAADPLGVTRACGRVRVLEPFDL